MQTSEIRKKTLVAMHRCRRLDIFGLISTLTRSEFLTLEVVKEKSAKEPHDGVYVSELAEKLSVSTPAVSRMLRSMEESGLIERRVDKLDRRNTRVFATSKGFEASTKVCHQLDDLLNSVIDKMGEEDMLALIKQWNRMLSIAEDEVEKRKEVIKTDA